MYYFVVGRLLFLRKRKQIRYKLDQFRPAPQNNFETTGTERTIREDLRQLS